VGGSGRQEPVGPGRGRIAAAGRLETVISVNSEGPYFVVTAHDAKGRALGRSATVKRTTAAWGRALTQDSRLIGQLEPGAVELTASHLHRGVARAEGGGDRKITIADGRADLAAETRRPAGGGAARTRCR
jgi:hypothetical protein